jgi:hypothetical protein
MAMRGAEFFSTGRQRVALAILLATLPAMAQYTGKVTKSSKDNPTLRSIAVLEWTGEEGKPKASRLVPIAVLDTSRILSGELQDGGIYLARPLPMALDREVEYELQKNGKSIGLFDVLSAGQEQGSWVGHGTWKPLPVVKPKPSAKEWAVSLEDEYSDRPVLHRKKHASDSSSSTSSAPKASGKEDSSSDPAAPADPDRPTLHKKSTGDSTSDSKPTETGSTSTPDTGDASATDPDRPTLHKKDDSPESGSSSQPAAKDDPDRPTLKKNKKKQAEVVGHVDSLPDVTDPDRPTLKRGKSSGNNLEMTPTLMGLPAEMEQAVAVSDAKTRTEHLWSYSWSNPEDEAKMKSALEELARSALGLNLPPAVPVATPKKASARKKAVPVAPVEPQEPAPLMDEHFRVFELAYGSGATLVLSARTDAPIDQQKFVTLVAQPDLYGNLLVLLKSVTDVAHLDASPRLRLVDAVDAQADNRGELLFELRGATQRQFALYRILRGQAEKLFVTSGGEFAVENRE